MTSEQRANVERWIEELESGRWRKARKTLHNKCGGHCCLGVAQRVFDRDLSSVPWMNGDAYLDGDEFVAVFGLVDTEQSLLARANDESVGFDAAIKILRDALKKS